MKTFYYSIFLCLFSLSSVADNLNDSNMLFDFAEKNYSDLFSPAGQTTETFDKYLFRHYPNEDIYLATSGDDVYYFAPRVSSEILHVGVITDYITLSSSTDSPSASPTPKPTPIVNTDSNKITRSSVVDCSSLASTYGAEVVSILSKYNYKKCATVAGILIVNSNETVINGLDVSALTQMQADLLAEILDNNQDGTVDDASVVAQLKSGPNGAWMNIQSQANETNEQNIIEELSPFLGKDMGVKYSWIMPSDDPSHNVANVLIEEAIHMWHMLGYAKAYPAQWGINSDGCGEGTSSGCDFTQSTLTQLAWEAMTVDNIWYQHPENTAPSNGVITGGCTELSCSAIEFIMNVLVEYRDIYQHVSAVSMPSTSTAVAEKLDSTEKGRAMKILLQDQLANGISRSYTPSSR